MHADPAISAAILGAFQTQVKWCEHLEAPFTAALLRAAAREFQSGGKLAEIIGGWPGDPKADLLPLRINGALNALVLTGTAPELASVYPPHARPDEASLQTILASVLRQHGDFIRRFIVSPPQTNEVGRSAALLGGFLEIAAATKLPLRLLEIGASAGLNLLWDRFFYRLGDASWGDPAAPVQLAPAWQGSLPPLTAPVRVAERTGCDLFPIDIADPDQRLRLRAYMWVDHTERMKRLDGAIALARREGVTVERSNATAFVQRQLATPRQGTATVLYHSIMWNYVSDEDKAAVTNLVRDAAGRATPEAPLAWLRFELEEAGTNPVVNLTLWPGGLDRRLAVASPHGATIEWVG